MKKFIFLIVSLAIVSASAMAETLSGAMLSHNGETTMYNFNQLPNAVAAAVAGDTIFLSEGGFVLPDGLTIDKPITIVGCGQGTVIDGGITVNIGVASPNDANLLDALRLKGSIKVEKNVSKVKIRKCWVADDFRASENAQEILIDRCYIRYSFSYSGDYQSSALVSNSVIYRGSGCSNGSVSYINCNIQYLFGVSSAHNCIVRYIYDSILVSYTLCWSNSSTNTTANSYYQDFYFNFDGQEDDYFLSPFTKEELESNGYLGEDGTVVGIDGGATPFTLEPSLPTVTESSFELDSVNKKLNVNLKVTSN